MNQVDLEYARIIKDCLNGHKLTTRNAECYRVRNRTVSFTSTPLVGARKTAWKNCLREWEWFMSGSNDINTLHPSVRSWWEPFSDGHGILPYNYSKSFRGDYSEDPDQIEYLIDSIRDHPNSRRMVATTWIPSHVATKLINPTNCHGSLIQCFVEEDELHLTMYQRSADVVCGLSHNWLQYWAFTQWLAHRGGRKMGTLTWIGGDVHVYAEHKELAEKIVEAVDHDAMKETPRLVYSPSSDEFLAEDFSLDRPYEPVIGDRAKMIV